MRRLKNVQEMLDRYSVCSRTPFRSRSSHPLTLRLRVQQGRLRSRLPEPDANGVRHQESAILLEAKPLHLESLAQRLVAPPSPVVWEEAVACDTRPVKGLAAIIPERAFSVEIAVVGNDFKLGLHEAKRGLKPCRATSTV